MGGGSIRTGSILAMAITLPVPAGASDTFAEGAGRDLACGIRQVHENGVISLEGRAFGTRSLRGEYRLEVQKDGPSGTASTSQAGRFEIGDAGEAETGNVSLTVYGGSTVNVQVDLTAADGNTASCSATVVAG